MTDAPASGAPDRSDVLRKRLLFLVPLGVAVVVLVAFLVGLGLDPSHLPSALKGKPAPEFALPPLLEGQPGLKTADLVAAADATGADARPSLVNFFASWCVPCRAEHPLWMRVEKEGAIKIHGIAWKDDPVRSRAFLNELGDPYTLIGVDRDNQAGIEWGVYGVPETFVVDPDGTVRLRHAGPVTPQIWNQKFLPLLRGAE